MTRPAHRTASSHIEAARISPSEGCHRNTSPEALPLQVKHAPVRPVPQSGRCIALYHSRQSSKQNTGVQMTASLRPSCVAACGRVRLSSSTTDASQGREQKVSRALFMLSASPQGAGSASHSSSVRGQGRGRRPDPAHDRRSKGEAVASPVVGQQVQATPLHSAEIWLPCICSSSNTAVCRAGCDGSQPLKKMGTGSCRGGRDVELRSTHLHAPLEMPSTSRSPNRAVQQGAHRATCYVEAFDSREVAGVVSC